jgi:ABC-2 type transport system permease protein
MMSKGCDTVNSFMVLLKFNIRKRLKEGYALGYNVIFPLVLIGLLGVMTRNTSFGEISSFQYYHVVMIPYCILMSVITAAYSGKDDAFANTAKRVLLTPISIPALIAAKVLACTIVITLFSFISYLFLGIFIAVDYSKIIYIFILYCFLSFFSCAIGCLIGLSTTKFVLLKNIINIPLCIIGVFGGCFFQCYHDLSMMTWVNKSIFLCLYDNQIGLLLRICGLLGLASVLIVLLAIGCFKKEEYYVGSLPSYEK